MIIYFYPKDNTSGYTKEAREFTELMPQCKTLEAHVSSISPDPGKSHIKFINKYDLSLELLSDCNYEVTKMYDV